MNRNALVRYWPLAALVAVQALIIAIAPSTAPSSSSSVTEPYNYSAPGAATTTTAPQSGLASGSSTTTTLQSAATTIVGALGSGTAGTAPTYQAGSTTHCVAGHEFSTAIAWYAPACTPGSIGVADPHNGGATYQGVTATQITVVDYVANYGPEVNAILQAQGQYTSFADESTWDGIVQNFINTHYVLYGRKLKIIPYNGQCVVDPPDTTCLDAEMDSIVEQYQPYVITWDNNTVCSQCYAEIARDKTIGMGGFGFSDELSNELAPFFYSIDQSSTRIETAFAEWWCAQMSSVNDPARVTSFAGTGNKSQNFNGEPRRLGVLSTNDPDNENTVTQVLEPALQKDCGDKIWHTYFYSQNINTAAQQVSAGLAAMDTATNPATSILCLCDSVAPTFIYTGESAENYYPENIMADDQLMDFDVTSQGYSSSFDNAVGLSPIQPQLAAPNDPGYKVWTMEGQPGSTLASTMGSTPNADSYLQDALMMAALFEVTGPDLTPSNMQAAAPNLGAIGGGTSGNELLQFLPGDYHWTQDDRVVYWDSNAVSPYNGDKGTYCSIEGARFNLGQFPTETSGPPVPAAPRPGACT